MNKRSRDSIWGFLAPISPLAQLFYLFSSKRRLKSTAYNLIAADSVVRYLLIGLLATSAISAAIAVNPVDAVGSTLALLLFIIALAYGIWGIDEPTRFLTSLVLGGGLVGLVVVVARALGLEVSLFGVPILEDFTGEKPRAGLLGIRSNGLAALLEPAVIGGLGLALLKRKGRLLYLASALLALAGIFVTFSRGSLVGLAAALALLVGLQLIHLRTHWKPVVALLAAVAVAACLVVYAVPGLGDRIVSTVSVSANIERVRIWTGAWHMIRDYPLFGSGPGNFTEMYAEYMLPDAEKRAMSPHSLYLYILSGWGVVGFLVFFGLVLRLVVPPIVQSPTRLQLLALTMALPFWIHVAFDDLYTLHVPLIMGCIANQAMRRSDGDQFH